MLWVHLNTDYPFLLNGILYFPKLRPDVDVTQGQIKLFCNQVFVSDHCEEIIPEFLMPLRGVIDSPDIPLNVSRSSLTNDRTVRRIADFIAKKIASRLKTLYSENAQEYIRCWQDIGTFIKYGSLKEEKFKQQVEDILIYQTTYRPEAEKSSETTVEVEGEEDAWESVSGNQEIANDTLIYEKSGYTTLNAYLERNKDRHENRVFYCIDAVSQATYVELYKKQGLEILFLDSFIDTNYFIPFLEKEHDKVQFVRVDADLDQTLLDEEQSKEIVDPSTNKTRSELVKELFEKALDNSKINVRTQALKSDNPEATPPAMVLLPEAMRRFREMSALMQQQNLEFPEEHVLTINTSHPLIENIYQLSKGSIIQGGGESPSAEMAKLLCLHVYDLALMAQKGFDAQGMNAFVERSNQVLTRLTEK